MPFNTVGIIENKQVAGDVFALRVPCADAVKPGQFYMLRDPNSATLLPRPISVCDWQDGALTLLYQVVGRGTGELSRLRAGDKLSLLGPLGNGFPLEGLPNKVALVGGGIGTAPLLLLARELRARDFQIDCLLGFRDEPLLTGQLSAFAHRVEIATESGRIGHKGFVTGLLDAAQYGAVLCCGPLPMMRAVTAQCIAAGTPVYVSLENKMACGLGGCLVCTCTDKLKNNRRVCKDGPVFRGEEIDFDA